jgi:hypothetical protein
MVKTSNMDHSEYFNCYFDVTKYILIMDPAGVANQLDLEYSSRRRDLLLIQDYFIGTAPRKII